MACFFRFTLKTMGSNSESNDVEDKHQKVACSAEGCGITFWDEGHSDSLSYAPSSANNVFSRLNCLVHVFHPMAGLLQHCWKLAKKLASHHSRTTFTWEDQDTSLIGRRSSKKILLRKSLHSSQGVPQPDVRERFSQLTSQPIARFNSEMKSFFRGDEIGKVRRPRQEQTVS